ncbi:MAG: hypothetical protein U0L58_04575 [Ruminococcus sp.]|nr:hypothetical protein [Ruminococcus sp.]
MHQGKKYLRGIVGSLAFQKNKRMKRVKNFQKNKRMKRVKNFQKNKRMERVKNKRMERGSRGENHFRGIVEKITIP